MKNILIENQENFLYQRKCRFKTNLISLFQAIISLYLSAMAHRDSKWPKIGKAKAINIKDSDRLC